MSISQRTLPTLHQAQAVQFHTHSEVRNFTKLCFMKCVSTTWEISCKQYSSHYNFSPTKENNVNLIQDIKQTNKIYWGHTLFSLSQQRPMLTQMFGESHHGLLFWRSALCQGCQTQLFWWNTWSTNHNIHGAWENHVFHKQYSVCI